MRPVFALLLGLFFSTQAQVEAEESGVRLVIFEKSAHKKCTWSMCETSACKPRSFLTTDECPTSVRWDGARGRSFFQTGSDKLFLHDWKSASVLALAAPPAPVHDIGIAKSGDLIIATMEGIPDASLIRAPGGELLRNAAGYYKFRYEGKIYEAPLAGTTYMGALWSSPDGKKWQLMEKRPTSADAYEAIGIHVFKDEEINPDRDVTGLAVGKALDRKSWPKELKPAPPAALVAAVKNQFPENPDVPLDVLNWGTDSLILFEAAGEYPLRGPFFRVNIAKNTVSPIDIEKIQTGAAIEIRRWGAFALFSGEGDGQDSYAGGFLLATQEAAPTLTFGPQKRVYFYVLSQQP